MHATRLALPAAVLIALAQAAKGQDEAALRAQAAAIEQDVLRARVELATAAFDQSLWREASIQAQAVLLVQPEHALLQRTQKLKRMDSGEFVRTYKEAIDKTGRAFRKRQQALLAPPSKSLADLGDVAQRANLAALAEQLFVRAYEIDSDNQKARDALRKLDYDAIFNYGVLPKEQKNEARTVLRTLGGKFLQRADLAPELEMWADAWGLETRHYRFVTNAPHATVFGFAQACERLFAAWDDFMVANKQDLRTLNKQCTVYLFRSRTDYETLLRLQSMDPPDSDGVLGFYTGARKIGYFYYDAEFYAGDTTKLFETFYHEGSHQLIDLRLKAAWRGRAEASPLEWVEEGLCVYLESLCVQEQAGKPKASFGGLVDDDLGNALEASAAGALLPMAEFAHIDGRAWNAYENGYPHAALLVHWLMHADGGKRRAAVFDLLVAERQNGGLRKGTLFDLVGVPAAELDATLKQYAAQIDRDLPHREYKQ